MPSFVNDENSPLYSPSAGIVRLDHRDQEIHHHQFAAKLVNGHEKPITKPLPTPIDHCKENSDDNASTLSTQSTEPRPRMNGDMTALPNGRIPQLPNGVGLGAGDRDTDHNSAVKTRSGAGTPVEPRQPMSSGTTARPNGPSRQGTSDSYLRQGSLDSTSMHQSPTDLNRRSFANTEGSQIERTYTASITRVSSELAYASYGQTNPSVSSPMAPFQDRSQTSEPQQRFSSPPSLPPPASSSVPTLQSTGLKQRHTLEVPKSQPGRGSRDGNETAYASGRFSPSPAGPSIRRGSLSLGRRNTRSLHSDAHRDEVVYDEDALRWAEAYRQKRAKKKKREEEDDDRVLVGTKVDENHANWTTAYNMLTGIRVSVSRTNAKLDRPLTDADFEVKQKSTFDMYVKSDMTFCLRLANVL